ncbi:MAG: alkaline phosphatase family protein [Candidatus Hodarchaeota archaeon]
MKKGNRQKKSVIIGLDGVPYRLINYLSDNETMLETKRIVKKGIFKHMESSIPEISCVAWSSIITGKNPGKHGIFGYTDIPIGTYRLSFPNFNNLKAEPFWQKKRHGKSIIINVPSTFPAKPLNGVHISGFVSLDLERSVYPKSLIPKLTALDYQIDVDSSKAHKSIDLFLNDLDKTLKARIAAFRYLWKEKDWDTFMLVFTGTDRLSHFLWDAYEDENHEYHTAFLEHFRQIDDVIGEIADELNEDDLLLILSDHGFELLEKEVNINYILRENRFLNLKPDAKRGYADIDRDTRAFALEPARIYLNLESKFPRGSVKKNEYDILIEDLISIFKALELNGKKIIKNIFRKEEIYRGPFLNQAPDLVLIPDRGFDLKASLKATELYTESIFKGKHTQHDAFLLVNKSLEKNAIPDKLTVSDICGIIDKLKTELNRF